MSKIARTLFVWVWLLALREVLTIISLYHLSLLPKLTKLTIVNAPLVDLDEDIEAYLNMPIRNINLSGLKELVLDYSRSTYKLAGWGWFWKRCSNVERLELDMGSSDQLHYIVTRMSIFLPKLKSLLYDNDMLFASQASLLRACKIGWREVRSQAVLCQASCKALIEHSPTLEIIQATSIGEESSSTLLKILSLSPRLRILITSDDNWPVNFYTPHIEAEHFIDAHHGDPTPWACEKSIKILKTIISGIPRPEVNMLLNGRWHIETLKENYAQDREQLQKCVYMRLSRLTNLEELSLGHCAKEGGYIRLIDRAVSMDFQCECLEMTLESGLHYLEGLKNLRLLDIRRMAQWIGTKEVQWMARHWPSLRIIRGLYNNGRNLQESSG